MKRHFAALAAAVLLCASPALAQDKQPPLRTGVDGTFAPHAFPKPGGGTQDFCWLVFERGHNGIPEIGWLHRDGATP